MVQLTWLGHSSFELRLESGEVYLLDPWLDNPKAPGGYELSRLDGILLTHGHFDHMASVVDLANQFACPVLGIYDLTTYLEEQGVKQTVGMNKGGTGTFGKLEVTLTFASHSSPHGDPVGFIIALPNGKKLYFAGDTDVFGDMRLLAEIYGPEIVVLPIGDFYTMGPKQASYAIRMLKPKIVVPMHYGTFPALSGTPEALRELVADLGDVKVLAPQPGESIEL
ncbi:MAG: metal-dependent hydrolase [Bryobacter sp.]|nr:metal-dependent hydrolase [Bryobacter sp.]